VIGRCTRRSPGTKGTASGGAKRLKNYVNSGLPVETARAYVVWRLALIERVLSPMACTSCGSTLPPDFLFCPRCGRRQPAPCPACSFSCEADFAYCPRCGTAIGPGAPTVAAPAAAPPRAAPPGASPEADRRQVTVLFADVSGYTALAERLDPEELRAFQNALFESLSAAIARYDGFAEKFVGDAVLAVFGAPVAHEDDPQRALSTALDMLAASDKLSEQWAARLGQSVRLHIGVHTGPVVAGSLGNAALAAYAVTGDTVNTTARLLAAASGTILVSGATHALTRHRFAFEPARQLTLRGKAEPIAVHRLVGVLAEPQSGRGLAAHGLTSPMIGRVDELTQLLSAFDRMQRGSAQLVCVVGEAGAGKSRLLAEFLARLAADGRLSGTAVRQAACSSLGEPPYGIFSALFRDAYHLDPSDTLDVARQKLAAGLDALGARSEVADTVVPVLSYMLGVDELHRYAFEPEQLKRQIALAVRTLMERRLEQEPLLFIVEDVHWVDAASVDLLGDVVDHLVQRRLMVLLSHRSDTRPLLVNRAAQSIIRLGPLSQEETRALLGRMFGGVAGDAFARVQEIVAERAGGNPLFVEEMVRSLVREGRLVRRGDRWECTDASETADVPVTLQGLLLSRVDRLPAAVRRLLQKAAVLGASFGEALLDVLAAPERSAAGLDHLVGAELIAHVGHGHEGNRYRFTHALVHEIVYQNLLLSRRTELHERAGAALEAAVGPNPERLADLEALGHHWSLSANRSKGARYLAAAGDRARAVYANEDAIRHYQRALSSLGDRGSADAEVRRLSERLADLLALTGKRLEAVAHYEDIRVEVEKVGDREGAARLWRKIGGLHWEGGERERAKACFTVGLERLSDDGSPLERAQLFQEMGRLAFRAGDNSGAISWAERALCEAGREEAQDAGDTHEAAATRAQACNTLGVALARTGRLADAVGRIEHSIALAEKYGLPQAACRGYTNLGILYSSLDPRRSIETCLHGLETAKKVGDLGFQSRLYANLAVAYCSLTDRCEAEGMAAAQKAIELDRRLGLLDHLAVPLIVLGQIHQCHGDHGQALAAYQEALDLAEQAGEPQLLFPCYDGLATLHLDAGDRTLAETYLAKSQEVCARAGLDPDALMVLPFLC
jgi:predicted ATPase/class 3 adenylate cyclase